MAGVKDCMTKSLGSSNQKNLVKATMLSLLQLQSKETIAKLRDVELGDTEVEAKIAAGMRYLPQTSSTEKAKAPVNKVGQKNAKGGARGGGRGRRGRDEGAEAQATTEAPAVETPAAQGEATSAE
jgi:hypothetical protein